VIAGRVVALWRYPVKSMAAEPLESADVGWHGVAGDRRWAFVQEELVRSGFPWLTIRERAEMWHYEPSFANPERPDASRTLVRTPSGRELDVVDPELAEELGGGVRVIKQNRGVFDTMPLSLITTQTIASLGAAVGEQLEPLRFRPNLLVEANGDARFPEDAWVGAELRIGGIRMRVDQRDERCVMTNVNPQTAERDLPVLKTAGATHDACAGVYGTVVEPGRVAVGDSVVLG
jgi:uncharacterized protein